MAHGPVGRREAGDVTANAPPVSDAVLFEFIHVGNSVKVTAVDPSSGLEVSIVGDPAMGEFSLRHAAARKLAYVLRRGAAPR